MTSPLSQSTVNLFQRGTASLGRINALLAVAPDIVDPEKPRTMQGTRIEIRNLTFAYPSNSDHPLDPALTDIQLSIEEGTTTMIMDIMV